MFKIDFAYAPVVILLALFICSVFLPMPYALIACLGFYPLQYIVGSIRAIGLWIRKNKTPVADIDSAVNVYLVLNTLFFITLLFVAESWSLPILICMAFIWGIMSASISFTTIHEASHRKGLIGFLSGAYVMCSHYKLMHIHHHKYYGTEKDSTWPKIGTNIYTHLTTALFKKQIEAYNINPKLFLKCMLLNCIFPIIALFIGFKAFTFFILHTIVTVIIEEVENYIAHYGLPRNMPEGFKTWGSTKEIYNIFSFNLGPHENHHKTGRSNYIIDYETPMATHLSTHYEMIILCFFPKLWFKKAHNRMKNGFKTSKFSGLETIPKEWERLNV